MEKIVELARGAWRALVDPSRGANCIKLSNSDVGADILRSPADPYSPRDPYLYGMPILFPANRISGGVFAFEGREYRFPVNERATLCHLHGALHSTPFEPISVTTDSAAFRFEGEYLGYPQAFGVEIRYTLSDEGLVHEVTIENASSLTLPLLVGYHTTFNVCFMIRTRAERVRVLADLSREIERDASYLPTGRCPLPDEVTRAFADGTLCPVGTPFSRHYRAGGEGRVEMIDPDSRLKVVYRVDKKLPWRLFYNGEANGILCLEPMSTAVNAPNLPPAFLREALPTLAPRRRIKYVSSITLEEEKK